MYLKDGYSKERVEFFCLNRQERKLKKELEEKRKQLEEMEQKNRIDRLELDKEVLDLKMKKILTDKQELFCLYYSISLNAVESYMKAYESTRETASFRSGYLMKQIGIRAEIKRLKEEKRKSILVNEEDIVLQHVKIAFSDIKDFVNFGTKKGVHGNTNFVDFKESDEVDGQLINSIKCGKQTEITLADRQKSLEWLSKYFDMNPDEKYKRFMDRLTFNHRVKTDKEKIKLQKDKIESDTLQNENNKNAIETFINSTRKDNEELKEVFDNEE